MKFSFMFLALLISVGTSPARAQINDAPTIYHDAVLASDVANAKDKSKIIPSQLELEQFIESKCESKIAKATLSGVVLKNQSTDLIFAFKKLTELQERSSSQKAAIINFKKNYSVAVCDSVVCAVKAIWGESLGVKILYLYLKYGFNSSEFAYQNAIRFTEEEMNDVLLAVADLPPNFAQSFTDTPMSRSSALIGGRQGKLEADSTLRLYDAWAKYDSLTRQYVIFHELAHNMGEMLGGIDFSTGWKNVSGWQSEGQSLCSVSDYGNSSLLEDFAESVSMYRYRSEALKKICKGKYNFIKTHVFNGVEY